MKKTVIAFVFATLLLPSVSSAAVFNKNLYYGIQKSSDVSALQEFLTENGNYSGPITGNFFSLTLAAVKRFQVANNIKPVSGYFGILSRGVANSLLDLQAPIEETGTTTAAIAPVLDPVVTPPVVQAPSVYTAPPAQGGSATIAAMTPAEEKAKLRSTRGIGRVQAHLYIDGANLGISITDYFSDEVVSVSVNGVATSSDQENCGARIQDSTLLLCGWYATIPATTTMAVSVTHQGVEKSTTISAANKDGWLFWF